MCSRSQARGLDDYSVKLSDLLAGLYGFSLSEGYLGAPWRRNRTQEKPCDERTACREPGSYTMSAVLRVVI